MTGVQTCALPIYKGMISDVHNANAKIMISTWASFGKNTPQYKELEEMGRLIHVSTWPTTFDAGVAVYDPYIESTRDLYWKYIYNGLISKGIDAYWLDSSEPDHYNVKEYELDYITGLGCTWRKVRNAFPLVHVGGVYNHHRAEKAISDKRVMILTRSAFAGQQRYAANTWSGDIVASWTTLANQIPAALNFSACGIPNWNSDIGGFFRGNYSGPGQTSYNELYIRWLQFGTFCPMMRSHGTDFDRAIYRFGSKGSSNFTSIEKYINLRYSLLPYIYSTSWGVANRSESFMRPLSF